MGTFSQLVESGAYTSGKEPVLPSILSFERLWYQAKLIQNVEEPVNLHKEFVNLAAHELRNPCGYYFNFIAKCHNYILPH